MIRNIGTISSDLVLECRQRFNKLKVVIIPILHDHKTAYSFAKLVFEGKIYFQVCIEEEIIEVLNDSL